MVDQVGLDEIEAMWRDGRELPREVMRAAVGELVANARWLNAPDPGVARCVDTIVRAAVDELPAEHLTGIKVRCGRCPKWLGYVDVVDLGLLVGLDVAGETIPMTGWPTRQRRRERISGLVLPAAGRVDSHLQWSCRSTGGTRAGHRGVVAMVDVAHGWDAVVRSGRKDLELARPR